MRRKVYMHVVDLKKELVRMTVFRSYSLCGNIIQHTNGMKNWEVGENLVVVTEDHDIFAYLCIQNTLNSLFAFLRRQTGFLTHIS